MAFLRHGSIVFDAKGQLPDIPENQELFCRLKEAPELTSEELFRLAEFYKGYPTNVSLGNHLAQVALTKLERHRGAKGYRTLQKIVFAEYSEWADTIEDSAEAVTNVFTSQGGVTNDEGREDISDFRLFIRHLPAEGLLIETISSQDKGKEVNYNFVIGFGPVPADLQHE